MSLNSMRRHLPLALALACGAVSPSAAQEAGILPPLVGFTATWERPPAEWAACFKTAGWEPQAVPDGDTPFRFAGTWLGQDGMVTVHPMTDDHLVRKLTFESAPAPQDTLPAFLSLLDSLTARFGEPSGWGPGGFYRKERALPAGVLAAVWKSAGPTGDHLELDVFKGALRLQIRSAAYQAELDEKVQAMLRRRKEEEQRNKPKVVVDPSHVYEQSEVEKAAFLSTCHEKPPKTGYKGSLTITGVVAPWGQLYPRVSLEALVNVPYKVQEALEDWINTHCAFIPGMIDGKFVYSRTTFTVDIDS